MMGEYRHISPQSDPADSQMLAREEVEIQVFLIFILPLNNFLTIILICTCIYINKVWIYDLLHYINIYGQFINKFVQAHYNFIIFACIQVIVMQNTILFEQIIYDSLN